MPIRVGELEDHAARTGADPAGPSARATFVANVALRDKGLAWPPRRNDPCWCGSGRKYKKCCDTVVADRQPTTVNQRSTAYELDVRLAGVSPPVWRRFQIRADATFQDLHYAIQFACGWDDAHLFRFSTPDGKPIARAAYDGGFGDPEPDAQTVGLSSYFGRHNQCMYEYDFGDSWMHLIVVRERIDQPVSFRQRLIDGRRAFPPEDCGGLYGYERAVDLATDGADPDGLGERLATGTRSTPTSTSSSASSTGEARREWPSHSPPQAADRHSHNPFAKLVGMPSSVEHSTADEPSAKLIAQPGEMACIVETGTSSGLHLEREDPATTVLSNNVKLAPTLLNAQMMKPWPTVSDGYLCSELCDCEGVEQPAKETSFAEDTSYVEP